LDSTVNPGDTEFDLVSVPATLQRGDLVVLRNTLTGSPTTLGSTRIESNNVIEVLGNKVKCQDGFVLPFSPSDAGMSVHTFAQCSVSISGLGCELPNVAQDREGFATLGYVSNVSVKDCTSERKGPYVGDFGD